MKCQTVSNSIGPAYIATAMLCWWRSYKLQPIVDCVTFVILVQNNQLNLNHKISCKLAVILYRVLCAFDSVFICLCLVSVTWVCVCVRVCITIKLWGQVSARTWCCEVVGSCKVRFSTSSQLGPHKWMLRRPMMSIRNISQNLAPSLT